MIALPRNGVRANKWIGWAPTQCFITVHATIPTNVVTLQFVFTQSVISVKHYKLHNDSTIGVSRDVEVFTKEYTLCMAYENPYLTSMCQNMLTEIS